MRVTKKTHWQVRLQSTVFTVLFLTVIGLIAFLSVRYNYQADWTMSGRNTLSPASQELLKRLEGPITIISFVQNPNTKQQISTLIQRYQQYKPDLELKFINPETNPDKVRELGVMLESQLIIKKDGRQEKLQELSEEALTNALNRVARSTDAPIVFLEGHGERNPLGRANFDLGNFTRQLKAKGFNIQSLNLSTQPEIPDNTQVLVIASPQADLLAGEVELIQSYVKKGGNLLWLTEPGSLHGLESLAKDLGIKFLSGTIIDPSAQLLLGRGSATFALVPQYSNHPITSQLTSVTLFPQAAALETGAKSQWQQQPILTTLSRAWLETSSLKDEVQLNEEQDTAGPLTIGLVLDRKSPVPKQDAASEEASAPETHSQRIVVIGDGDFLSNIYLGSGSNLDLGFNLVSWLAYQDRFIAVPARTRIDTTLEFSATALWIIGLGFPFVLPVILLGMGLLIWWRRRSR